jgi:hypothetical protein
MDAFQVQASILSGDQVNFSEFNVLPKHKEIFYSIIFILVELFMIYRI